MSLVICGVRKGLVVDSLEITARTLVVLSITSGMSTMRTEAIGAIEPLVVPLQFKRPPPTWTTDLQ